MASAIALLQWILLFLVLVGVPVAMMILFGLQQIETGTVAAVFRFGKLVRKLDPGLGLTLWPIERVEVYPTSTNQIELPDESQNIDRDNDNPPPGKTKPYFVPHKAMTEAVWFLKKAEDLSDDDPASYNKVHWKGLGEDVKEAIAKEALHAGITAEWAAIVEWHLKGDTWEHVLNFVQNVSPEAGRNRKAEVRKRFDDEVSHFLGDILAPVTFGHASERLALFSTMLKERLEIAIGEITSSTSDPADKPWGIDVGKAFLKTPYSGRRVNEARADAVKATAEREGMKARAEGEKAQKIATFDAEAHGTRVNGQAEADALTAMAKAMKEPGAQELRALQVAEKVLDRDAKRSRGNWWYPLARDEDGKRPARQAFQPLVRTSYTCAYRAAARESLAAAICFH
ncbi:hypothetical protein KW784_01865 [Candidatus Parcubacteria bacterium]|nr:hypothetical protein [Candidatus Parcubacteria bacterium]